MIELKADELQALVAWADAGAIGSDPRRGPRYDAAMEAAREVRSRHWLESAERERATPEERKVPGPFGPDIAAITETVSTVFRVSVSNMRSRRRVYEISRPRQIVWYLARELTTLTLQDIGAFFGGKNHSTILEGVRRTTRRLEASGDLTRRVDRCRLALGVA